MAAMAWVGGMLAMSLVVQPVLRGEMDAEPRLKLYGALGRKFFYVKWGSWMTLACTGAFKLWELRQTPEVFKSPWGVTLAVKLSLVAVMVVLSQLHSSLWGPKLTKLPVEHPDYAVTASRMAFWGKVNLAVIAGIVFCAACLRMRPFSSF